MSLGSGASFCGTSRFRVEECIGRGGMGEVYRAFDCERGADVALKVLRGTTPMALYRFKHEFRALANTSHPNLLTLYELASADGEWFFTMELIDGCDFMTYVRGNEGPAHVGRDGDSLGSRTRSAERTLPTVAQVRPSSNPHTPQVFPALRDREQWSRLVPAVRQLAQGVRALHGAGHLHRDIKPSNILVTAAGRVVVLDFGVVTALADTTDAREPMIIGTPAYMAPEQGVGEPLTEASDWYAVGVVLFEAMTGRRPFYGDTANVIALKRSCAAAPVREWVPDAPPQLATLCDDLLERDPDDRPSGEEILARLGATSTHLAVRSSGTMPRLGALELVGRAADVAVVESAYAAVVAGERRTVLISGDSGIGKSALVRHVLVRLREGLGVPPIVLDGRCYEQESVPFKAVDSLVDALARHVSGLDDGERERLLPAGVGALTRMFPVLRVNRGLEAPAPPDPHQARRDATAALRALLVRMSERAPVILHIDDAQWGDADSAALLAEVLAPPAEPPVMLLLSYRTGAATTSVFLRTFSRWHGADASIALEALSPCDAETLAAQLLARDGAPDHYAPAIARESGGNPFFVAELARHVRDAHGCGASADPAADADSAADSLVRLDATIQRRYRALPAPARELLTFVVVAGLPVDRAVIRAAALLGPQENAAIALLRNTGLVSTRRSRRRELVEPFHARVREAILAHLDPAERRRVHRALAFALEEAGGADAETLATHFAAAGKLERAARYTSAAAVHASESLAFDRAALLYRRAVDLQCEAGGAEPELIARLAAALADAGHGAEAGEQYLVAAERVGEPECYQLRRLAADQFLKSGRIAAGRAVLREVLGDVGQTIPRVSPLGLGRYATRRGWLRLRGWRCRERPESDICPVQLRRVDACFTGATGLGIMDGFIAADFQSRYQLYALRMGEPRRLSMARALDVMVLSITGAAGGQRWQRALALARQRALEHGHCRALGVATTAAAMGWYQAGEFRRAQAQAERALEVYRSTCTGVAWEIWTTQMIATWSTAALGQLGQLREQVPRLVREAEEHGNLYAATNLQIGVPALRFLAADDVHGLHRAREEVMRRWPAQDDFLIQHFFESLSETMARLYAADGVGAAAYIEERWRPMAASQVLRVPIPRVETHYLRACAAIASGDSAALARAAKALRAFERRPMSFARALGAFGRAGIAFARGDRSEAEVCLVRGIAHADAAECDLYGAAARLIRGQLGNQADGDLGLSWLQEHGVVNPVALAAALIPIRVR